jgi:hypothetical protein
MNFRVILFCGIIFFVACTSAMPVDDSAKEDPVLAVFDQASRNDASATEGFVAPAPPDHVKAAMDTLNAYLNNRVERTETEDLQDVDVERSSAGCAHGCYISYHWENHWNAALEKSKTPAQYDSAIGGKNRYIAYCAGIPAAYAVHWYLNAQSKCSLGAVNCDWRCAPRTPDPNPVVSIEVEYTTLCSATKNATASCATVHNVKSGMKANSLNQHQVTDYTSKARAQAEASWDKISAQAKGSASFSSKQVQDFRQSSRQTSTETSSTVSTECTTTNQHGRYSGCYVYQVVSDIKLASGKTIHQSDPRIHIQARPLTKFHFKIL